MEKIISPDNIEYQEYLSEISLFFKNKSDHEDELSKKSKKKSSTYLYNISYKIEQNGDLVKEDKNKNMTIKIIKPKYVDIFDQIHILETQKEKYKTLLIRMRDEILTFENDDISINQRFYENREKYNEINTKIKNLKIYFNQINNIIEVEKEIQKLELEKDKYQENQRKIFSELKLISSETPEWKKLAKKYFSIDKDSDRMRLKQTNEKLLKLTKILFYDKNDEENYKKLPIKAGKIVSERVFAGDIGPDHNIYPRLPINFEITSLPVIERYSEKKEKTIKIKDSGNKSRDSIFFNSRIKDFNFLSNFSVSPFKSVIYGFSSDSEVFEWPTVEHYFQSAKFSINTPNNIEYIKEILKQKTPALAKRLGSNRKPSNGAKIREDWDSNTEEMIYGITLKTKDIAMMEAISNKFSQNEEIKRKLINTYPKILIEKSTSDDYWGSGRKGDGLNMLGKIIMNYRDIIFEKDSSSDISSSINVSPEKIILKKNKKHTKTSDKSEENSSSSDMSGGSILKAKGTKKNQKNISWNNKDSLGHKLNDSNYELDKNIQSIDLNNLSVELFDSENDMEEIIPISDKIENKDEENIKEIDLNNILSNDSEFIDIKDLNTNNTEEYKVNNTDIKSINIKMNNKNDNQTSYFSDIDNKEDNVNLLNLMNNSLNENLEKNVKSPNLKNITIKLR